MVAFEEDAVPLVICAVPPVTFMGVAESGTSSVDQLVSSNQDPGPPCQSELKAPLSAGAGIAIIMKEIPASAAASFGLRQRHPGPAAPSCWREANAGRGAPTDCLICTSGVTASVIDFVVRNDVPTRLPCGKPSFNAPTPSRRWHLHSQDGSGYYYHVATNITIRHNNVERPRNLTLFPLKINNFRDQSRSQVSSHLSAHP